MNSYQIVSSLRNEGDSSIKQVVENYDTVVKMHPFLTDTNKLSILEEGLVAIGENEVAAKALSDVAKAKKLAAPFEGGFLGVYESLEKFSQSTLMTDPRFKTIVNSFATHKNAKTPEFNLVESFVKSFGQYSFDAQISEGLLAVKDAYNKNIKDIYFAEAIQSVSNDKNFSLYKPLLEKLNNAFVNGVSSYKELESTFKTYAYNGAVKNMLNKFNLYENANGITALTNGNTVEISQLVSPVLQLTESENVFSANGVYFKHDITNGRVEKLSEQMLAHLPKEFMVKTRVYSAPNVKIENNGVRMFKGTDMVELKINESGSTVVSLNNVPLVFENVTDLYNKLISKKLFKNDFIEFSKQVCEAYNGMDSLSTIDFVTVIKSKLYENVFAMVVNQDNKLALYKHNPMMNESTFVDEIKAKVLVESVNKFLTVDISESFKSLIENENLEIKAMNDELSEISENIQTLNAQLAKVKEISKLQKFEGVEEISKVETLINEEIENLTREYNEIKNRKTLIESGEGTSDFSYAVGDLVKINGTDKIGKVTSIDTNSKKVSVMIDGGDNEEFHVSKVKLVEAEPAGKEGDKE